MTGDATWGKYAPQKRNVREWEVSCQIGEIVKSQYLSRINADHDAILFTYLGLGTLTENMHIRSNVVNSGVT